MNKILVETDIGHDPDDLFTLIYLLNRKDVDIGAVSAHPGHSGQIAILSFLREHYKKDFLIGATALKEDGNPPVGIHAALLKAHKYSSNAKPDYLGREVFVRAYQPNCELLVIGPAKVTGDFLLNKDVVISKATMQGGFLPYSMFEPAVKLEKFIGVEWIGTYNPNGAATECLEFVSTKKILNRKMVGKNVCHRILLDNTRHFDIDLMNQAASLVLKKHPQKKFHDPVAAICHLHPEIGTWFNGHSIRNGCYWSTCKSPSVNDWVLADINENAFWEKIQHVG